MFRNIRKLIQAILLLILSLVIGILGFHLIEGYNLTDAFYMSVITISTVGFSTVGALTESGKIFVSFFIIFNLVVLAYGISVVTMYIFEGGLRNILRKYKFDREIRKMKNHVIVCGYGRNGARACSELLQNAKNFIVIENNNETYSQIPPDKGIHAMLGDATFEETLKLAMVETADFIITTLPRDSDNVFIALTAKEMNPSIKIISRASDPHSEKKLERAGVDKVIMPDILGGLHMAQLITKPYVIEFLELLNGIGEYKLRLEEITWSELKEEFRDKTIAELHIRKETGVTVVAYKNKEQYSFNPGPETKLIKDTIIIIVGEEGQLDRFKYHFLRI